MILSVFGNIEFEDQRVQEGSKTRRAMSEHLGIEKYSLHLQRIIVDLGSEDSYELAAKRLKIHHAMSLSATTIRKITNYHGLEIQRRQQPEGTVGEVAVEGQEVITAQADGTMLPILTIKKGSGGDRRKRRECQYNEFRLCAARAKGSMQTCYGVSQGDVNEAGFVWADVVAKSGWGLNSKIHVVCDGAKWITQQAQANFGKQASVLIDFYHLSEYLAGAAEAIHGSGQKARNWLHTQQKRLKSGNVNKTIEALDAHLENKLRIDADAPVRLAHRYMTNRPDQLNYKQAIEEDLPIGSGLIEGGHRHVLHKRLKLSGAWWKIENATAIAHLRVARANNQEQNYWDELVLAA